MRKSGSFIAYCGVAIVSAAVSALLTWQGSHFAGPASAQTAAPAGTAQLLTQALADLPGREVRITLLDRAPNNASPPHHHPGHHTFGYVVQGAYELGINNQPTRILKAGDVFYEPPGAIHSVSKNVSPTDQLKIIVFMVADARNPSTVND